MEENNPAPVREGDVLAKKYRIEKVLGVGGMGVVVAAYHLQLDQRVALKFLLPTSMYKPNVVHRFEREARAAARIKSEHVGRVLDVGELENGLPYMVMEFLEGEDLAEMLEKRGPLPVTDVVAFVLQACDAIAEAHATGIVHRDLKPSNLFLARRPDKTTVVKVLDFGISKVAARGGEAQLTETSALLGSPVYMSPEQMVAPKTVDSRSDIWAVGVIVFELLTGRTPFLGESLPELIAGIIHGTAPDVRTQRSDVPPGIAAVVSKCLAKEADGRFRSIADLTRALAPFAPASAAHIPERVSRVLGEDFVPVPAPQEPQEPLAVGALATTLGRPTLVGRTLPIPPVQSPGTHDKASWSVASADVRRPPTSTSVWLFALVGVVVALSALGVLWRLASASAPTPSIASSSAADGSSGSSSALTAPTTTASTSATRAEAPAIVQEDAGAKPVVKKPSTPPLPGTGAQALATTTPSPPKAPAPPAAARPTEPTNKLQMDFK